MVSIKNARAVCKPWPPPMPGKVALSVDGSFSGTDISAGSGMILRNGDGSVTFSGYRHLFHCNDGLEAELHAIMEGMSLFVEYSPLPMVVRSDSTTALSVLSLMNWTRQLMGISS